jgi:transcriptional regulator with XRE-family HTH domain
MARKEKAIFETEKMIFPTRLRLMIEIRKITQPILAEYVGCTRQAISLYATGQSAPDIYTLQKIAEFFDCSTDYLLGLSESYSNDIYEMAITDLIGLSAETVHRLKYYNKFIKESRPENLYFDLIEFLDFIVSSTYNDDTDVLMSINALLDAAYNERETYNENLYYFKIYHTGRLYEKLTALIESLQKKLENDIKAKEKYEKAKERIIKKMEETGEQISSYKVAHEIYKARLYKIDEYAEREE